MEDVTYLPRLCPRCGKALADGRAGRPLRLPACSPPATETLTHATLDEAPTVTVARRRGAGVTTEVPRLADGQSWGPYRIGRLLGRGGMGEVYEAEHAESGRRIALKVLRSRLQNADERARFLREGQLAASISHPHTVYIFGSEEIAGTPVISMELLPGGTLKDRVAAEGPLPPRRGGRRRARHHRRARRRAGGGHSAPRHQAVELLRRQRRLGQGRRLRPVDLDAGARRPSAARHGGFEGTPQFARARAAARRAARRARRHLRRRRDALLPADRAAAVRRARSARTRRPRDHRAAEVTASAPSRDSFRPRGGGPAVSGEGARAAALVLRRAGRAASTVLGRSTSRRRRQACALLAAVVDILLLSFPVTIWNAAHRRHRHRRTDAHRARTPGRGC